MDLRDVTGDIEYECHAELFQVVTDPSGFDYIVTGIDANRVGKLYVEIRGVIADEEFGKTGYVDLPTFTERYEPAYATDGTPIFGY